MGYSGAVTFLVLFLMTVGKMKKIALLLVAAAFSLGAHVEANAQRAYVTYYQPAVSFYQPATVYRPVAPCCAVPRAVYYAAPVALAPVAPAVAYQPVARVRTRYRPFLGGTVSRVRYGYAPAYVAPAPAVVAY